MSRADGRVCSVVAVPGLLFLVSCPAQPLFQRARSTFVAIPTASARLKVINVNVVTGNIFGRFVSQKKGLAYVQ